MNICAHLKIIRQVINERSLQETVDHHNQIFEIVTKFNDIYKFIIFGEYAFISVTLAVNYFLFLVSNDNSTIFVCILFGVSAVNEVLIYSYGGQKIMDFAEEICDDCYEINKDYLFIMMRTRHQLKLSALLYVANLETVTLIMNRAMAVIALLQSME